MTLTIQTSVFFIALFLNHSSATANEVIAGEYPRRVAIYLEKPADFDAVTIDIICPHPDPIVRFQEMALSKKTFLKAMAKLKEIEIRDKTMKTGPGASSLTPSVQSSLMYHLYLPPAISTQENGDKMRARLKRMLDQLTLPGNTFFRIGPVVSGIRDPHQYRAPLLERMQVEFENLKHFFGEETQVILWGLQNPIQARLSNTGSVELYLDYRVQIQSNTSATLPGP